MDLFKTSISFYVEKDTPKWRLQMATESYGDASRVMKSTASERSNALLAFEEFNQHLPNIKSEQMKDWYGKSHLASGESAIDALYDTLGIEENFLT